MTYLICLDRYYFLQYVSIMGVFDQNPQNGGIELSPGGHTALQKMVRKY